MERFYSSAPGSAVGNGFLHDRDLDELWTDDLLRAVLHPRANPSDRSRRNEPESERRVDEADRQECDWLGGRTWRSRLSDSRSRLQIHSVLRWDSERRQYRGRETSAADPGPECVCGAVRSFRRKRLAACDP